MNLPTFFGLPIHHVICAVLLGGIIGFVTIPVPTPVVVPQQVITSVPTPAPVIIPVTPLPTPSISPEATPYSCGDSKVCLVMENSTVLMEPLVNAMLAPYQFIFSWIAVPFWIFTIYYLYNFLFKISRDDY